MVWFHWTVQVQAGCDVARKSRRWTGSRNQPEIVHPTRGVVEVLERGEEDEEVNGDDGATHQGFIHSSRRVARR